MQSTDTLDQKTRHAARRYLGEFCWPTVLLGFAVISAYVSVLGLVALGSLSLLWGTLLVGFLTYAAYTVLHEAAHGTIAGSHRSLRWLNELMGYLAGWIMMIPLTAHRHEHLSHHRNTNNPEQDPDYTMSEVNRSPWHALRALVLGVYNQYRYYLTHRWHLHAGRQNLYFCLEIVAALLPRLAFVLYGFWLEGVQSGALKVRCPSRGHRSQALGAPRGVSAIC